MGNIKRAGKGGGFDTGQYGGFDPFAPPIAPIGGRTGGGKIKQPFGGFKDMRRMPPRPSLQQQYAGLNQGVQGFQPLGIRGYTPPPMFQPQPIYGGPVFGYETQFNPFGYGSLGGNPFLRTPQLPEIPFTPPVQTPQPGSPDYVIPDDIQAIIDGFEPQMDLEPVQRQEPVYQTQVVQGGRDIINRIDPPIVEQPTPIEPAIPSVPTTASQYTSPQMPIAQTAPFITNQPIQPIGPTNLAIGKASGGRVLGFAEGGMPEENQTSDRLEEETIMALMGKHPNPKEVFIKYMEVYGENGLMQLATEVEEMMRTDGRMIDGPGGGVDDFVPAIIDNMQPAALSKDEYVIPADVVAHAGDGSSEAGGKEFDKLVSRVRKTKTGNTTQPEQIEFEEEINQIT